MAVELIMTNKRTGDTKLIPIATSQAFRDYWKAGSVAIGLRLVPLLEDGLFERGDIPNLIIELGQLKSWFQKSQPQNVSHALSIRIDNAISAFEHVWKNDELTIG